MPDHNRGSRTRPEAERSLYRVPWVGVREAPAGEYALLVGNPTGSAPAYERERLRDVILTLASVPAVPGASGANPEYGACTRFVSGGSGMRILPQMALWVVLVGAVVALTALTLRLARREESGAK